MPVIIHVQQQPICKVGPATSASSSVASAFEEYRHHYHCHHPSSSPICWATYVRDIFFVMEKPVINEQKNTINPNIIPSGSMTTPSTLVSINSKVYPKPKFLKLLQSVGAKGKAFQISEIINYLKEYISSKQLFDQQKPWLVHCENDYLGSVFHCKQFTIDDVRNLLNQNVTMCKSDQIEENQNESFDSDATEILVSSMSDSDHEPPKKPTPLDDIISSSTSETPKPNICSTDLLLRVKSSFLEILKDVGAKGEVFREKEIFRHLKNYVWSRRLFDPLHPWICLCHNDKLADVFKCDKFLIHDVPHLVAKFGVKYAEYHPKNIRANSDPLPKSSNVVTSPLQNNPKLDRTKSTPSDITSSTADVIAPSFARHEGEEEERLEERKETFSREEEEDVLVRPTLAEKKSGCSKSGSLSINTSPPSTDHSSLSVNKSCEGNNASSLEVDPCEKPATSSCSNENDFLPMSLSQFNRFSGHNELSACPSSTNSFTLTLEMENDNEVLSFQSEDPVDDVYVEYEVMSNSSSFHPSDSEDEHHKVSMDMLVICQDSDIECYADYSDTGSDTDIELTEADKWFCSNCNLPNSPIHRQCDRCWTLRPDWLPDRTIKQASPKQEEKDKVQKRKSLFKRQRSKANCANSDHDDDDGHSDASSHFDDPEGPSSRPTTPSENCKNNCSNETLDLRTTLSNICHFTDLAQVPARRTRQQTQKLKRNFVSESEEEEDSDICSKLPKMSPFSSSSPMKSLVAPGLCIICLHNPRDASLIHGASGHQVCCLTCAKKLKRKGSKCPICRRTIQKVIRNYLT